MQLYRHVVLMCIPLMPGALKVMPIAALEPKALQTFRKAQKELK